MIIAKFGGTSLTTAKRIHTLCDIVKGERNKHPLVVVSALAGITNLLLSLPTVSETHQAKILREIRKMHKLLIEEFFRKKPHQEEVMAYIDEQLERLAAIAKKAKSDSLEDFDTIASFGEIMSSFIVTRALEEEGIKASQVIATDLIITNNTFGAAEFLPKPTAVRIKRVLQPMIKNGIVPVITGFIAATRDGKTTTLGRGGSDYTASILGFALRASEIQIWTDVDGIFTADPRFVQNARLIPTISFKEASELATFGARVLHPRTIKPAIKAGIPVRVLNTLNPKGHGTSIVDNPELAIPVRAVCAKRNIPLVNIYSTEMLLQKGFLARIFTVFAKHHISIDLVSVSEVSVSVTLDNDDRLSACVKELESFSTVTTTKNQGIVSIIGSGIAKESFAISQIFDTLNRHNILVHMVSLGTTDINISLVIENSKIEDAVRVLHDTIVVKGKHI